MVPGRFSVGGVVSTTVTVKLPLAVPVTAVAVQLTVVVPRAKVEPDAGVQEIVALSVAVTVNETAAPLGPVASAVMFAGSVSTGPLDTVTLNVPTPMLACASYAMQVTVVVPRSNVAPEGGEQCTVTLPLTASVADAVYVTT